MPIYHTWNELHVVLLALGYRQVITKDERMIYVSGNDKIVIQKLNELDIAYVLTFCKQVGIKYLDFLKIYKKEYDQQQRNLR